MSSIGWGIKQAWSGTHVRRAIWEKGLSVGVEGPKGAITMKIDPEDIRGSLPYTYMLTLAGDCVPWLYAQDDLLASDWEAA